MSCFRLILALLSELTLHTHGGIRTWTEFEEVAAQMRREIEATFADRPELRAFWLAVLAQACADCREEGEYAHDLWTLPPLN